MTSNPSFSDLDHDVYLTPQSKIDEHFEKGISRTGKPSHDIGQYIYQSTDSADEPPESFEPTPGTSRWSNISIVSDSDGDYVLSRENSAKKPEIMQNQTMPMHTRRGEEQDIYDEDNYTLARPDFFGNGNKPLAVIPEKVEETPGLTERCALTRNVKIILIIVAISVCGALIAGVVVHLKGKVLLST